MRDRFRFRVWDTYNERFMYEYQSNPDFAEIIDDSNYTFEQCTGLKDKNGNLIYEGDIVRLDEWFGEATAYIKYEKYSSCYKLKNKHDSCLLSLFVSDEMEVIGDIHNTPELLEENNG